MKHGIFLFAFAVYGVIFASPTYGQQPGKIFRIGLLDPSDPRSSAVRLEPFWQEIRRLGWIEGKNLAIEYRFAEEKSGRLPIPVRVLERANQVIR